MNHIILPLSYSGVEKDIEEQAVLKDALNTYIGLIISDGVEKKVTLLVNVNTYIREEENMELNSVNVSLNFSDEEFENFSSTFRKILTDKDNIVYSLSLDEMLAVNVFRDKKDPRKIKFFFSVDKEVFAGAEEENIIGLEDGGSQFIGVYEASMFNFYNFFNLLVYYMEEVPEN